MVEPADAKELIDQAIERAEEERDAVENVDRATETRFRDQISILIGILAVSLAIIHMAAAGAARDSLLKGIEASDTFAYMQAKITRETVYKTASASRGNDDATKSKWLAEANRLRAPDQAEHGIGQLQTKGERLRKEGRSAADAGEGYELGETALQMAIVLMSIAIVARSRRILAGALLLGGLGIGAAIATATGFHVYGLIKL